MLVSAACYAMVSLTPVTQEGQAPPGLLNANESKGLRDKLRSWVAARLRYDQATGAGTRQEALREQEQTKATFHEDWDRLCKQKGDLLESVTDLRHLFDNLFEYQKSDQGQLHEEKKDHAAYFTWLPKSYASDVPIKTILLVPGFDEKRGNWQEPRATFADTWEITPSAGDLLCHVPLLDRKWLHELDRIPDYTKPGESQRESERIMEVFKSFGETSRAYNFDRRRLILDVGRESSGFGLRLASYFPDRFAGVIVRWPVEMKGVRLGSLTGLPVLVISSPATDAAASRLEEQLELLAKGSVTKVVGTGDYPFQSATPKIEKWVYGVQRNLMRSKVVIEPNDDRYRQAYWAGIDRMDQVATAPEGKKPRLEVTADRANNRIEVRTTAVASFNLYLNDSIVDLDKPFTLVINGKARTEQRTRDLGSMVQLILRKYDGSWVFPVTLNSAVPQEGR
jgi:hypothetical protein